MNRELTLREKVLLLILIVLVMVLGYFKLLYAPVSDRLARCREDTAQEQLALEQNAVRLAQMEKMEQALADIRAAGGSKAIPRFNNSEALLRELRESAQTLTLTERVAALYERCHIPAVFGAMRGGAARRENLRAFFSLAEEFARGGGRGGRR